MRNVVHRACILTDVELIEPEILQLTDDDQPSGTRSATTADGKASDSRALPDHWLESELAEIEREIILAAIKKFGNRTVVAKKLGVSPRTLFNKVRQYRDGESGQSKAA